MNMKTEKGVNLLQTTLSDKFKKRKKKVFLKSLLSFKGTAMSLFPEIKI